MFKCQLCGTQVPRGVSPVMVVTGRRARVYSKKWIRVPNSEEAKEKWQWRDLPRKLRGGRRQGKPRFIETLIPENEGWEIAQERRMCRACAKGRDC